jgi:hypothetical protein
MLQYAIAVDLGERFRSTYVGSYIIYFREKDGSLESRRWPLSSLLRR